MAAVIAATAAGCSESSRFGSPLFTGSTQNQREIIGGTGDQPMPPAVASSAVTRSDLPPPGGAVMASAPQSSSPALPAGDYVWTPDGVKPKGAASVSSYAPSSTSASQPTMQAAGGAHVVAPGQTLYAIGRLYGVRPSDIASANGLSSENIRVGQRLQIPGAGGSAIAQAQPARAVQPTVVASTAPAEGYLAHPAGAAPSAPMGTGMPVATSQPQQPRVIAGVPAIPAIPSIPVETKSNTPAATPVSTTAAVDEAIEPASANGTSFRWPVRGRIISGFGAKPNGEKNDGINLAVPEGTAVKAAEAGTVIYAGNELEGYGKLVLIRHADDWVSAYAHNSNVSVKKGDAIRRGQTIGTAGMTGSVSSPQVHFELRKKAKPVNPLDYLAGA